MSRPSRPSRPTRLTPCLYRLTSTLALLAVPPVLLATLPGCSFDAAPVIPAAPPGPPTILGPAVPVGVVIGPRSAAGGDAEVMVPVALDPAEGGDDGTVGGNVGASLDPDDPSPGRSPTLAPANRSREAVEIRLGGHDDQIRELFNRVRVLERKGKD